MRKPILLITFFISLKLFSQDVYKYSRGKFDFYLTERCETDECSIIKIEIYYNKKFQQKIEPDQNYYYKGFSLNNIFIIEDMNFDGNIDFRLFEHTSNGPSIPYFYWIFNSKNKIFERNLFYDEIPSPDFDYSKKEISTFWRDGCCRHGRTVYKLFEGKPIVTEEFVMGHKSDKNNTEYSEYWKAINGKLKLVRTKTY